MRFQGTVYLQVKNPGRVSTGFLSFCLRAYSLASTKPDFPPMLSVGVLTLNGGTKGAV